MGPSPPTIQATGTHTSSPGHTPPTTCISHVTRVQPSHIMCTHHSPIGTQTVSPGHTPPTTCISHVTYVQPSHIHVHMSLTYRHTYLLTRSHTTYNMHQPCHMCTTLSHACAHVTHLQAHIPPHQVTHHVEHAPAMSHVYTPLTCMCARGLPCDTHRLLHSVISVLPSGATVCYAASRRGRFL